MARLCFVALGLLVASCTGAPMPPAPPNPAPLSVETRGGTKIHVIQTGWVAVKRSFRDLEGPGALRLLRILSDGDWTEWFPIQLYAIERPGGVVVFDAGETARVAEEGYFDCEPGGEFFYRSQLRFAVAPEDELGPGLQRVGIDPAEVRIAVLSHLHSDHIGGLSHLPNAELWISEADAAGHQGALLCRLPADAPRTLVAPEAAPFGAFAESARVGGDAALRIVPTPGHTPGHQSLLLDDGGRFVFFAGDAVFDLARARAGGLAGIAQDLGAARETVTTVKRQLDEFETVLAPAHDGALRSDARFP